MSHEASRPGRATVLFVVACVLAAAVAPAAVAGGLGEPAVDRPATGVDASSPPAAPSPSTVSATAVPSETPTSLGAASSDAVGPGLRSANGTVELVVRFGDDAGTGVRPAGDGSRIGTDELKTNAATAQDEFERFAERKPGVTVDRRFWLANAMLVTVDTESVAVERLVEVRGVERVHENFRIELDSAVAETAAVGDPGAPAGPTAGAVSAAATERNATYGVDMVRAPEVWDEYGTRGSGATVAVLDTGVDPDHPDLTVSGWAEIDENGEVVRDGGGPYDRNGHGTHVAGTVAGGNASGTAIGVAPEATLHAIKVFPGDERTTTFTRVIGGMEAALNESVVGERADVIQMSLGADEYATEMIEPVRNANAAGAIVVASAGNGGANTSSSPGNVHDSLSVGAVDTGRDVPDFSAGERIDTASTWGADAPSDWPGEYVVPDVSAPGVNVNSSVPGGGYDDAYSGTSMAAPHVSGVAALMIAASTRDVTEREIYDTLRDTAVHPNASGPDTRYGAGVVDGYAAVSSITENRSNLTVTAFDAPNETVPGATVETTATVNNTGADPGSGTVEYRFDGTVGDADTVDLAPGENATVSFSYTVPPETATSRAYEHGAYTNDTNLTSDISVVDGPLYTVTNLSAPSIVGRNATLAATANVTNRGGVDGDNRSVELRLTDPDTESDVRVLNATNLSLGAGDATTLTLSGTVPGDLAAGAATLAVASPDGAETASIRVAEAVGTVNGTVSDAATDAALAGIDVTVRNGSTVVGETATAADGTYAVDVPAASLTVTASNATYAPANASATLTESGETATANLSLALRNGTLAGAVNAGDDLDGPANATLTVTNETNATAATVDVESDGTYSVALRPGTYDVDVAAPDFAPANASGVAIGPNATTRREFGLDPLPATLSGTVTADATGDPVDGATVTVAPTAGGSPANETQTDGDGNYSVAAPRGEYRVAVAAEGYANASRTLSLAANGSTDADFAMTLPAEFVVADLTGPSDVERGESGDFSARVRNDGGTADRVTVTLTVSPGGASQTRSLSAIDPGASRSTAFTVLVDDDAATGTYETTASTPDDSRTVRFEVVAPETNDGGGGDADGGGGGGSGGGGGGGAGGGGGGGGGGTAGDDTPPDDEGSTDASENETDDGGETTPIDQPANGTESETANGTENGPENGTESGPSERGPVEALDGDADGPEGGPEDESNDGDDGGDDTGDNATSGASGPGGTDDDVPGFGAVAAVAALAVVAALGRRFGAG